MYDPKFMGVDYIGSTMLLNELENNYKSFLEWGFLNIGGFTNVNIPSSNISSLNLHKLKLGPDKNNKPNCVWQTPRKDWVYETGVAFSGFSPILFSGVYVNSQFIPAPTGNSEIGYKINYPEGKIIFNNPLPPSTNLEANYSYKNIQIYKMEEFPYFKELQQRSLDNKSGFENSKNGDFSILSENRVQLPCIIIETVARSNNRPFQLGNRSLVVQQDIILHILSDNPKEKNSIIDILRLQEDRIIWLYNTNKVVKNNIYPLNFDGSKNLNYINYEDIVTNNNYQWLRCQLKNITISDINFVNIRLYGAIIRITNEIIFSDLQGQMCI
jgi:hypothetical protein